MRRQSKHKASKDLEQEKGVGQQTAYYSSQYGHIKLREIEKWKQLQREKKD